MKVKIFGIILTHYNLATLLSIVHKNDGRRGGALVGELDGRRGGGARVTNQGRGKSQPANKCDGQWEGGGFGRRPQIGKHPHIISR